MEKIRYISGVSTLKLDKNSCTGCGMCLNVCPHAVFSLIQGKAQIMDMDGCMECGACAMNCPESAVSVTPGVGCAAYIISSWVKGKGGGSCADANCC